MRTIDGTPPIVRVFSPILRGVGTSQALLETLNRINSNIMFGRVLWAADQVIVSYEISAVRITAEQIAFTCLQIGALAEGRPRRTESPAYPTLPCPDRVAGQAERRPVIARHGEFENLPSFEPSAKRRCGIPVRDEGSARGAGRAWGPGAG